MSKNDKVRVAIIGVGNCSSSLVQGVEYYKNAPADSFVPVPRTNSLKGQPHTNASGCSSIGGRSYPFIEE